MKYLILSLIIFISGCSSFGKPYLRAGIGYKYNEAKFIGPNICDSRMSGRLEAGMEKEWFIYGWSHHSQPTCGKPFNDQWEYHKSEFFFDLIKRF